jgi:hypothetical protein
MRGYARNDDGTLERIDIYPLTGTGSNGLYSLGASLSPARLERIGKTTLRGWSGDDGEAVVCRTDAGREIVIPGCVAEMMSL